jgi:hypothetical protein
MKPPFSYEDFIAKCNGFITSRDIAIIKELARLEIGSIDGVSNETIKKWIMFDTGLRNELVKARAMRLHKDAAKYLHPGGYSEIAITHIALSAYREPALLEAEKILDLARWNFLEGLSAGHYFDSNILFIYALKLLILERWERIKQADKNALLAEVIK